LDDGRNLSVAPDAICTNAPYQFSGTQGGNTVYQDWDGSSTSNTFLQHAPTPAVAGNGDYIWHSTCCPMPAPIAGQCELDRAAPGTISIRGWPSRTRWRPADVLQIRPGLHEIWGPEALAQ